MVGTDDEAEEVRRARQSLAKFEATFFSLDSEEHLATGLDHLEDALFSDVSEHDKAVARTIAETYAALVIRRATKLFKPQRAPIEDHIDYVLRYMKAFSERDLGIKYDMNSAWNTLLALTLDAMFHGEMPDDKLEEVRQYLRELEGAT